MAEKINEKVEETTRQYMREAEDVAQNAFRTGNDLMTTTMKYYFDTFGTMFRHGMELTNHAQHDMDGMLTIYRRIYSDGIKSWEGYLNDVNKIFVRPTK
jgi:hypothetical protein